MGVPKFYRWISERYPCLSQVVKDYQIPEFDNFYLDMNGIIHPCSHPNDDDPSFRISEDKIFRAVFNYLEVLFRTIKPQRVLFMAVDGVAPRAKMNQQRGRRFRSAKDAEDLMRKAVAKGIDLPTEARFDSNCITPGTEFMSRLNEHLKYFINQKIATDPSWQNIEVIFSGHEVPGEGEHKIMDYIRYQKAQPGYDPNTRHCLYGLDADLIMLGMVTHEPHFSLLREEVVFGKKSKKQTNPDSITFHLLHLSILREYLDFEFADLKETLPFPYDLEHIIDDWVLMGFLVGNDFIPHLPNMHIRQEVLPLLYKKYIRELPKLGGYINENGTLQMERLEKYFVAVAEFDYDHFADLISGQRWLQGKKGQSKNEEDTFEEEAEEQDSFLFGALNEEMDDENTEEIRKLKRDLGISDIKSYFSEEDNDLGENFDKEMHAQKCRYYTDKFGVNDTQIHEIVECYIHGIQWILSYYYTGVPSWSWFYPYHYAPYVSDIKNIDTMVIEFEKSDPFLPFEQLLAVLPAASRFLLPKAFQGLMVNDDSEVLDFYPTIFDTDLNGKQHEWEAVVLIPFIDENRLLQAMKTLSLQLSEEEIKRNSHGPCLIYQYDKSLHPVKYPSPWPTQFPDINHCKIRCTTLSCDPYSLPKDQLVFGLCPSVKLDVYYPGFPTLKHIPHKHSIEPQGVKVFQSTSRGDNVCLKVLPRKELDEKYTVVLAQDLIGKTCYVGWPYMVEAKVWGVSDEVTSYQCSDAGNGKRLKIVDITMSPEEVKLWKETAFSVMKEHTVRRGIDLGDIKTLVYVQELQGRRYVSGPKGVLTLKKQWSPSSTTYPLQTMVFDIHEHAPEYREQAKTLDELYTIGSDCFLLHPQYYGEQAEILSVNPEQQMVTVKFQVQLEPNMDPVIRQYDKLNERYSPLWLVAQRLGLPPVALSKITATFKCEKGSPDNDKGREKFDLGLNFKFSQRNQELLGYARRTEQGWSLSPAAEEILNQYIKKFPTMFKYISENPSEYQYYESNLFPASEGDETITAAKQWLKSLPIHDMETVECGSDTLNDSHITEIEKAIFKLKDQKIKPSKPIKMEVKSSLLYKSSIHQRGLIPDEYSDYYVFDRVVNVTSNITVPFGLRGTITGIMGDVKTLYEVVFDEEFLGGMLLRCSGNRAYKLPASCLLNLSYGKRSLYQLTTQYSQQQEQSYSSIAATPPLHGRDNPVNYSYYVGQPYQTSSTKEMAYGSRSMEYVTENSISNKHNNKKTPKTSETFRIAKRKDRSVEDPPRDEKNHIIQAYPSNEFDLMLQSMQGLSLTPHSKQNGDQESKQRPSYDSSSIQTKRTHTRYSEKDVRKSTKELNNSITKQPLENTSLAGNTPPKSLPTIPPPGLAKAVQALPKLTSSESKDNVPYTAVLISPNKTSTNQTSSHDKVINTTSTSNYPVTTANTTIRNDSVFPPSLDALFKTANEKRNQLVKPVSPHTTNLVHSETPKRDLGLIQPHAGPRGPVNSQQRSPLLPFPQNFPIRGYSPSNYVQNTNRGLLSHPSYFSTPQFQPSYMIPPCYPPYPYQSIYNQPPLLYPQQYPSQSSGFVLNRYNTPLPNNVSPSIHPRGPKPSSFPTSLSATAMPFTPLQVQIRHAKSHKHPSAQAIKTEDSQQQIVNGTSTNNVPPQNKMETLPTTKQESFLLEKVENISTECKDVQNKVADLQVLLTSHSNVPETPVSTNKENMSYQTIDESEPIDTKDVEETSMDTGGEDEEFVEAIPSSDGGSNSPPVIVGEIFSTVKEQ